MIATVGNVTRPAPLLLTLATIAITATACGSPAPAEPVEPPPPTESTAPTPDPSPTPSEPDRAAITPASVKITKCKLRTEDYGGGTVSHFAEVEGRATNTTQLTGTLSITVQYQDGDGTAITEGLPGANNIRPGQAAKITDSTLIEPDDFPGGKVKCVVAKAEVYVVTQ
jgi:hypothetical protein